MSKTLMYVPGIYGHPAPSPTLNALSSAGWDVVAVDLPGFNGRSGFAPPADYLDWLVSLWDAVDALDLGPCPVIGASVGGMLAAELAALRPELVTAVALLAPFGITDASNPGLDLYALPSAMRVEHLFAKGVPDAVANRFSELGDEEAPVARYLCDMAAANLLWPLNDRGTAKRLHRIRCPRLTMFGDLDELIPVASGALWGEHDVVVGAGHLMEWDAPDEVSGRLLSFLGSV